MQLRYWGFLILSISSVLALQAEDRAVNVKMVSLVRLIAQPEQFDGDRVRLIGFLYYGGGLDDSYSLYISQADGRNHILANSIYIGSFHGKAQQFDRKLVGRYVMIQGRFRSGNIVDGEEEGTGIHYILFDSGTIDDIDGIALWEFDEKAGR